MWIEWADIIALGTETEPVEFINPFTRKKTVANRRRRGKKAGGRTAHAGPGRAGPGRPPSARALRPGARAILAGRSLGLRRLGVAELRAPVLLMHRPVVE